MEIYNQTQKKINPKIQSISELTEEYKLVFKLMLQEMNSITNKMLEDAKEKEAVDAETFHQKVNIIEMMVEFNETKVKEYLSAIRNLYLEILNVYENSLR